MQRHRRLINKIERIFKTFRIFWNTRVEKGKLKLHDVTYGKNLIIAGHIFVNNTGEIKIGDNVRINSAPWANPIGGSSNTQLQVRGGGIRNREQLWDF